MMAMRNYPYTAGAIDLAADMLALAVEDYRRGPGAGVSDAALKQTHDCYTATVFLEQIGQLDRVRAIHGPPGGGLPKTDRGRKRSKRGGASTFGVEREEEEAGSRASRQELEQLQLFDMLEVAA
jgi:hypothetical protein